MRLPDYNPDATCPKCAAEEIKTWHQSSDCRDWPYRPVHQGECLIRRCGRCSYAWAEACTHEGPGAGGGGG